MKSWLKLTVLGFALLAAGSAAAQAAIGQPAPPFAVADTQGRTVKLADFKGKLLDADGKIGRAYGARTTPHMYLIDAQGKLVYAGAIDSIPSANPADIKTATNYVNQALGEVLAGKAVSKPTSQAYGRSIKYASVG